ncbi:uncharacterized protein LOC122084678 isoform X2 [Macadamia integrifolia]|uniref:uncharacterized protein LOC122084678 isoform X2 n=1 Tax=Macadamia integrifolia TaxID=60698 RepID=UPI001C5008CC|nr:uncharacterized protein LOC122084678 isoform X2 [Macadamia integrifolia]
MEKRYIVYDRQKKRCSSKQKLNQQEGPSVTSTNVPLETSDHGGNQNIAVTNTPSDTEQSDSNHSQSDTVGSASSTTLADAKSTSSGLSMEQRELFGSSHQLSVAKNMSNENEPEKVALGSESPENYKFGWEGIPDYFEGFDETDVAGTYQYIEDTSGLRDLLRSFMLQVPYYPQQFDDFDFDALFPKKWL